MTTRSQRDVERAMLKAKRIRKKRQQLRMQEKEANDAVTMAIGSAVRSAIEDEKSPWAFYRNEPLSVFFSAVVSPPEKQEESEDTGTSSRGEIPTDSSPQTPSWE